LDLRKRLAQLDRLTGKPHRDRSGNTAAAVAPVDTSAVCRFLELDARPCPEGTLWQRSYRPDDLLAPPKSLPDLTGILPQATSTTVSSEELLFLDTETTGLVGGTGSLAFLIGVAWWEAGAFHVRQYFLCGPGHEEPILGELRRLAARFRVVVTYNGNGFDLPLLRTRALLSRLPDPCGQLVSWDLLTAVRRLWGRRLPDCRQQTVETAIGKSVRGVGDIPGAEIPQVYFRYLRSGDLQRLPNVLRHNRRDMAGMGTIFTNVAAAATKLAATVPPRAAQLSWQDGWSWGRICEARRDRKGAAGWLTYAVTASGLLGDEKPVALPDRFLADAVRILKRTGDWPLVMRVVTRSLARPAAPGWLHREAAILYEHRLGRPDLALAHAEALADAHRLGRLRRKLARVPNSGHGADVGGRCRRRSGPV